MRGRVRFDFANRGHACLHVQVAVKKSGSKQWDLGDYVRQRSEGAAEAPVALAARAPLIATRPMSVWALPALELAAAIRDDSEWDSESDESEEEEEEEGAPKRSERINVVVSVDLLPLPDIRCFFPRTIACVETSVLTICFCLAPLCSGSVRVIGDFTHTSVQQRVEKLLPLGYADVGTLCESLLLAAWCLIVPGDSLHPPARNAHK